MQVRSRAGVRGAWSGAGARSTALLRVALVVGLVVGGLVPVIGVAPAAHASVPARTLERVCPVPAADAIDAPPMADVGGVHADAIRCAADYGLVAGFEDGTYRGAVDVTRAQLATVLRRWIVAATGTPLAVPAADPFTDIAASVHRDAIASLGAIGIIGGRTDGTYGGADPVTRGQLARLLAGAIDRVHEPDTAGSAPPPVATSGFDDVAGTRFAADIRAVSAVGIVQGDDSGGYGPDDTLTRSQLATVLMRAADYLAELQEWEGEPQDPAASTDQPAGGGDGDGGDVADGEDPLAGVESVTYEVPLSARNVVFNDGGDLEFDLGEPGAQGWATLTIDLVADRVDFEVDFHEVTGPFRLAAGANIRIAGIEGTGRIVVPLATGAQLQASLDGTVRGSVPGSAADLPLDVLVREPQGFYLDVGSDIYPPGAIRGQLPDGGQHLLP